LVVTQSFPHLIQVLHGDWRCIEGRVSIELLQTSLKVRGEVFFLRLVFRFSASLAAVEWIRFSRAALVNQHDITLLINAIESSCDLQVSFGRRLAWPASHKKERVWSGVTADSWDDGEIEIDLPARTGCPVLIYCQLPTASRKARWKTWSGKLAF
jgi:hypothetical protein